MATLKDEHNEEYSADDIQVLEGMEAVRKRPGMYIGSTDQRGLNHLIYDECKRYIFYSFLFM